MADPPLSPLCALEQCSIVGSAFITFFFSDEETKS